MAASAGGSFAVWRCPSSSCFSQKARPATSTLSLVVNLVNRRRNIPCLAVQESSTSIVEPVADDTKEKKEEEGAAAAPPSAAEMKEEKEVEGSAPPPAAETKDKKVAEVAAPPPPAAKSKPKPAAKAPAKPLPELMEEDVIPSLRATLEAQQDISELEISFDANKLEGSFLKKGNPYTFWAFFPDGSLTGPKGFCLSSYGSGVSTVEPFLVDEKKPTAKHVVFWVEKRLAAQGILPVWKE